MQAACSLPAFALQYNSVHKYESIRYCDIAQQSMMS